MFNRKMFSNIEMSRRNGMNCIKRTVAVLICNCTRRNDSDNLKLPLAMCIRGDGSSYLCGRNWG